jgi:hypothetical protein
MKSRVLGDRSVVENKEGKGLEVSQYLRSRVLVVGGGLLRELFED